MKATETTVIDGAEYSITQLPGRRGLEMFGKLAGIMGPAALEALSKGFSMDEDISNLAPIGLALFSQIKPGELTTITDELFYAALINGKPLKEQADIIFQGKTFTLLKVIAFAVKVNYYDFFDALVAILKPTRETASEDSTT